MTPKIQINQAKLQAAFRKLRAAPEDIRRTNESLMRQMAGVAGVELANATNPPFFKESSIVVAGFKKRIKSEYSTTHPSPSALWDLVRKWKSQKMANQFWAIYQRGDISGAQEFLRSKGVPVVFNGDFSASRHKLARTGKQGRVPKSFAIPPVVMDRSGIAARDSALEKAQAKIGLAKAGWFAATNKITQSRAGGSSVGWVRALARKATGNGTLIMDAKGIRGKLVNTVPYASDAMNGGLLVDVPKRLYDRTQANIKRQLKYVMKKL